MIDVRYHHLADAPPLEDGASVRLLHGTAERLGRLYFAEEIDALPGGASCWAQIRVDEPLPCLPGDRFVLRRPSPQTTLGGGEIVDPWAPRLRRKDRELWALQLERLHRGERIVWLERAGEIGLSPQEWAERAPGERAGERPQLLGDRVLAPTVIARLEGALLEALERYHGAHPLSLGAHRRELRRDRLAALSDRMFDAVVDRLAASRTVEVEGPLLRFAGYAVELDRDQQRLYGRIRATIERAALEGVKPKELHETHPEPEAAALVHLLEKQGTVENVPGLGWVSRDALDDVEQRVRTHFSARDELTPQDFKEVTGLSRKGAIPLLEWLDRTKITRRSGDVRLRGPALGV
jgi:selenocysteine-specific elongation factor